MRGHVRKRGSKWCVVVDVGRDEQGKRRQKWRSGFATKREAETALTKLLDSVETGAYIETTRLTLAGFLRDEWLPGIQATVRPSTLVSYELHVDRYIAPALGSVPLQKVSAPALNGLYADLLANGGKKGCGLSARTVRYTHAVVRKALADAARWGRVTRNVADQATPSQQARTEMRTWTAAELRAFLGGVREDRLYAAWLLLC